MTHVIQGNKYPLPQTLIAKAQLLMVFVSLCGGIPADKWRETKNKTKNSFNLFNFWLQLNEREKEWRER